MKVSLNLAQYYSNVDLKSIPHDELLQRVGAQLGAVEEVIDWAPKYHGIVVVKVVTCEQHPNADRLHVCTIDDGGITPDVNRNDNGLVQVVCGAPNVKAGMLVAWIPPGAIVPTTYGTAEPFTLEARELRGVVSNGMLASAKELGISDDHEGILELTEAEVTADKATAHKTMAPGSPLIEYFGLDDFIIDCENKMFTHRPDCFGNLGVARELAGISGLQFKSPDWYVAPPEFEAPHNISLTVTNDIPGLVPRFMAVALSNLKVAKSPVWLQAALMRVGIKSINNVVDVTNYAMHITGQPLHAFDYDKLGAQSLRPRMAADGEKLALLNGKTIALTKDDMVISAGDRAVGLAGIMGGSETEVDDTTTTVVIECATFDMYAVRRSSMRHGLFTDASMRYTKGQSPLQNTAVLAYALDMLKTLTEAQQASEVYDIHQSLEQKPMVEVSADFINTRLGADLSAEAIKKLLQNVEFDVNVKQDTLQVAAPFWRTDIELPEDIAEEVGRLHGFDGLPVALPPRLSRPTLVNDGLKFKHRLRTGLAAAGANEVLSYSFVHGDLMRKTGVDPEEWAYHIRNALSPDLQYYRTSLLPSLLDKVRGNIRADIVRGDDNDFALFEIGKVHVKGHDDDDNLPAEMERIALVITADQKTAGRRYNGSAFYQAKHYLLPFVRQPLEFVPLDTNEYPITAPYQIGRSAIIKHGEDVVGVIGELRSDVRRQLKLPDYCAGFELDLNALQQFAKSTYKPVGIYPKIQQDITFEVSNQTAFDTVYQALQSGLEAIATPHGYQSTILPRDIFTPKDNEVKRLTFRIWLSHPARTLTVDETNNALNTLAHELESNLDAKRI